MKLQLAAIGAGFILDILLGDPHGLPHPVRTLGSLITWLEGRIRKSIPEGEKGELWGGGLLVLLVLATVGAVGAILLTAAAHVGPVCLFFVETVMNYYLLAARSLRDESMKVYSALKRGDVEQARAAVSMIVGRDTAVLDETGIAKAAVETVAENTSDGVIAPMFYLAIGGPLGGWVYKAVNTMDSMVGYRNDRYEYFGRAAARLDDVVNFIPARLSALLLILSAYFTGMDGRQAWRIFLRDRLNHKSPNSAQTEAACAGALRVRLAGDAWYFGKLVKKPFIGDALRQVEFEDIRRANRLMGLSAVLGLLLIFLCYGICGWGVKL